MKFFKWMFLNEKVTVGHVWARYASHTFARPLIMALAEGQILINMDEDGIKQLEKMIAEDKKAEAEDSKNRLTLAQHIQRYCRPTSRTMAGVKSSAATTIGSIGRRIWPWERSLSVLNSARRANKSGAESGRWSTESITRIREKWLRAWTNGRRTISSRVRV